VSIDLSIIIVNWNAEKHLRKCLNSIKDTCPKSLEKEIIVVDNASSDGSIKMLETEFRDVVLIKNSENYGFSKGNNIGIFHATGQYLCFINSDVIVLNGCFEALVRCLNRDIQIGLAGPKILNPDRTLQTYCREFPTIWNNVCQALGLNYLFPKSAFFSDAFMKYWSHDEERQVGILSGCFWIAKREALEEVGGLDEAFFFYGEDMDWCRRFHMTGWSVVFCPEAEVIHVGGASSSIAPLNYYLLMQKADFQYWKKHHGLFKAYIYRVIIVLRHTLRIMARIIQFIVFIKQRHIILYKLKRSFVCMLWAFGLKRIG
jgi:GT2 family glycosyltransferase